MEVEEAKRKIASWIVDEPKASNLLLTLFHSALLSYRRNSVCDPFPPHLICSGEKDCTQALAIINSIPPFVQLLENPLDSLNSLPPSTISLLYWILNVGDVYIREADVELFQKTQFKHACPTSHNQTCKPTHVFELVYNNEDSNFAQLQRRYHSFLSYHGSCLENWHSIVRSGFNVKFQKETSLFGVGLYLADDPHVALSFKKSEHAWKHSFFGDRLGCMVACEVLHHPQVKRGNEKESAFGVHGEQNLPKHYVLVENNDHVRVKYILVYSEKVQKKSTYSLGKILIILYVLLLIFVGLFKSKLFKKLFKP